MEQSKIIVRVATSADFKYASTITDEMASSAQARGTGIAKRSPEYIQQKMQEGKAIIAVTDDNTWVGFCYVNGSAYQYPGRKKQRRGFTCTGRKQEMEKLWPFTFLSFNE